MHTFPCKQCYHIVKKQERCHESHPWAQSLSHVRLFATSWTVAHQAPLSMGCPRQEYCSGLLFPPPGDLSNPGIEPKSPGSPALQVDSLSLSHLGSCALCLVKILFLSTKEERIRFAVAPTLHLTHC